MNKALALALIAAAAIPTGCASSKAEKEANPGECPNGLVLADAARMIDFDGEQVLENVAYTAEIRGVELSCRFYDDKPIDASLKVKFAVGRGPKGEARERNFTYFVAVTRTNLEVITKQEYTIPVKFEEDKPVRVIEEEFKQILIPRATETIAGTNFEVIVGLALTPEQVIFNRSGKSLKFPELK